MWKACSLAVGVATTLSGAALGSEDAIGACRAITDTAARLKCFDEATAPVTSASTGAWKLEEGRSELDRSRTALISLVGDKVSTPRGQGRDSAALVIRCEEGATSVYVAFSTLAASATGPTAVHYRLGAAPIKSVSWSGSQDGRAYGLFASKSAIVLAKELLAAPDLFVRGEARFSGTTEALFKLDGLAVAIKPIRDVCKW